jgi:hypothetical protein
MTPSMGSRQAPYESLNPTRADVIGNLPAAGQLERLTPKALFLRKPMHGVHT